MNLRHASVAGTAVLMALPGGFKKPTDRQTPQARGRNRLPLRQVVVVSFIVGALLYAGIYSVRFLSDRLSHLKQDRTPPSAQALTRRDVQRLLAETPLMNREAHRFEVTLGEKRLLVNTSLSDDLQKVLLAKLSPQYARTIAIVAIRPSDGRIVGLAGYDRGNSASDICLTGSFPAASIFKIVTAAAAIDAAGLKDDSVLTFNGQKHTLYRSQLKPGTNRYSNRISMANAFAESVNPVFGKIGMHTLGADVLQETAERFSFNREIPFEKLVFTSRFEAGTDPYLLAELASGFNRDTRLSALHGALMAAAIVNGGRLPQPRIVEDIYSENGHRLYSGTSGILDTAVSVAGAAAIRKMMQKTVATGTCRKIFHPYRRDRVLSQLIIGGKSGSIDNRDHDARYDWFVGFATDKKQEKTIAIAAVVAHQKYIGVRAGDYARYAIKQYFKKDR